MSEADGGSTDDHEDVVIDDVLAQLESLETSATDDTQRRELRHTRRMLERVPGGKRIQKYTTRDIAEGFVGGIIFALPLLVEDGVFEIAEWFVAETVGPVPVFLLLNVGFVFLLTTGLLYYTDIRQVVVTKPIFGVIPRRLVGVLFISLFVAAGSMYLWGRLHAESPTTIEQVARVTVIWAAAALGATLGDILPGESSGEDINDRLD